MYSYFGSTRFLIGNKKSFFWEHGQPKWETIMFASPRSIVVEKRKNEIYIYIYIYNFFFHFHIRVQQLATS
jgi:hypothetical protein